MPAVIVNVGPRSPAARARIAPGEKLVSINGREIGDVLDYKYHSYDARLDIELEGGAGARRRVLVRKREGADLGLGFETYLMDSAHACHNRCIFCFIDQMPKGMRPSLYFKDDDSRLSFLTGNYVTLTNLGEAEAERICQQRISPINISVHTTDPELRNMMLGNRRAGESLQIMKRFYDARIVMNCQIVVCPDINDGDRLLDTMRDLAELHPYVSSVSVVPFGATRHREGLCPIRLFEKPDAESALNTVRAFSDTCLEKYGSRIFFCSDEIYLKAESELPDADYYEGYPQFENGVGMLTSLRDEFDAALKFAGKVKCRRVTIATGAAAEAFLRGLIYTAREKCDNILCNVIGIENDFFGRSVTVAGLVTGQDLISQLRGLDLGEELLIPPSMLRADEEVFLDDVSRLDVERELGVPVRAVGTEGWELFEAIFEEEGK